MLHTAVTQPPRSAPPPQRVSVLKKNCPKERAPPYAAAVITTESTRVSTVCGNAATESAVIAVAPRAPISDASEKRSALLLSERSCAAM